MNTLHQIKPLRTKV